MADVVGPAGSRGLTQEFDLGDNHGKITLKLALRNVAVAAPAATAAAKATSATKAIAAPTVPDDAKPSREEELELQELRKFAKLNEAPESTATVLKKSTSALLLIWLSAYVLGHGIPTVLVTLAIGAWFVHDAINRTKRRALRAMNLIPGPYASLQREKHSPDMQLLIKQMLPPWMNFPDMEKCEWLNEMMGALWPHLRVATNKILLDSIQPVTTLEKHMSEGTRKQKK